MRFALVLASILATAPMQCPRGDDPALRQEDTPGDALYDLAQRFRSEGKEQAYRDVLKYIVTRYPSSRRAETARLELESLGEGGPPPTAP